MTQTPSTRPHFQHWLEISTRDLEGIDSQTVSACFLFLPWTPLVEKPPQFRYFSAGY